MFYLSSLGFAGSHSSFLLIELSLYLYIVSLSSLLLLPLSFIHPSSPACCTDFCSLILSVGQPLFTLHEKVTLVFFIESVPQREAQGEFHIHTSIIPTMHKFGFEVLALSPLSLLRTRVTILYLIY